MVSASQAAALTAAFHTLFDVKDEAQVAKFGTDNVRYAAYEAVQAIEKVMEMVGVEVPRRFDAEVK